MGLTDFEIQSVIQSGFEPETYCLEGSCSIQLSYWTLNKRPFSEMNGAKIRETVIQIYCTAEKRKPLR